MLKCWCCFFGNQLKISLFLVVVVGGIYTMTYPVFIYQKWGMQGKVRIIIIFSCGFSSGESNKESSWTSWLKCSCTGVDNNLFIDSPISYCHALKRCMVDAHPRRSRSFLLQKWLLHVQSILRSTGIKGTILGYWDKKE